MQLDILLLWILCPLISVEVTCSWIFCYNGYHAHLYQWRIHAFGYFAIMDIMPTFISGGYMQLDIMDSMPSYISGGYMQLDILL